MKPKPTDDPDAERERLYRAANRLSIKMHGCALDSLSRRHPEVIEQLYRYAGENLRQRYAGENLRQWQDRRAFPPIFVTPNGPPVRF